SDGNLLVGLDGGGIDLVDLKKNSFTHINIAGKGEYTGLGSDYIITLFIDSKENVWAGSWDKGLYVLPKGSKHFINHHTENTNGGLTSNTVMSITEDSKGTIWIGTYHRGIHSYDPLSRKFAHHDAPAFMDHGIASSDIWKVLVDQGDNIWLGTTKGLFKLERGTGDEMAI